MTYLNADQLADLANEATMFARLEAFAATLYTKDADIMVYCSIENLCESVEGGEYTKENLEDYLRENITMCHEAGLYV